MDVKETRILSDLLVIYSYEKDGASTPVKKDAVF